MCKGVKYGEGNIIFNNTTCSSTWYKGEPVMLQITWYTNRTFTGKIKLINRMIYYDGIIKYTNGAFYEGKLINGIRHDFGRLVNKGNNYCGY